MIPEWLDVVMWTRALHPWRSELLLAATIMSFADYVTTTMLVRICGPECESNRLLRWIMERWGIRGLWVFWVLFWAVVWMGALGALMLAFLTLMHSACVINNLFVLRDLGREGYAEA